MATEWSEGPLPNLFIVGAPKCGTTSLYEYLRRHPQIFFPSDENDYWRAKEPNHLCPELELLEKYSIKDSQEYQALYREHASTPWRGDASPYYLFSESAPQRIRQLCPEARILIMLRPPVAMMRSYHRDLLRIGLENIPDFYEALNAGTTAEGNLCIPPSPRTARYLDYFSLGQFAPQVDRYLDVFGKHAVKVVLLEDMAASPEQTFREILSFLGVDTSFQPEFRIHNETPRKKSPLERCISSVYALPGIKQVLQWVFPYSARRWVLSAIRRTQHDAATPDPRDDQLRGLCASDVAHLSRLIGRDLSHWQVSSRS